ncbi:MAG: VWA domain-containing protein [Kiritimatiellia bacterium]
MFHFAQPAAFLLLLPLIAVAWRLLRRSRASALIFTGLRILPQPPMTWRLRLAALMPFLFLAGLVLAIASLARPQHVLSRVQRTTDAVGIQMVLDTSGSMEALDFSTETVMKTRLDVVKDTFAQFIRQRPDDLIGLVAFAGYPSTRAPLTSDHTALIQVLETVDVPKTVLDREGRVANPDEMLTAIGDALATACARLEKEELKSKIIVLLSDGENNFGIIRPLEAIQAAKKLGIRIYAIGVGSTGMAPVKVQDETGREIIVRANFTLDEKLLRQIAEETNGHYFNVKNPKGLQQAMAEINRLEKTRVSSEIFTQATELFPRYLIPALILLALAAGFQAWAGRELV